MTTGPMQVDAAAVRAVVGFEDLIGPVSSALSDFSRDLGAAPVSVFAPAGKDGDVHVKSAWLPGYPIFIVKVATWFAERARRSGSPAGGIVAVFDAETGDLRALLSDDHHLSDVRTAAAGALAARHLAPPDSTTLGVLGTGVQAYLQVLAAASELPIRAVRIWGRRQASVRRLAVALRTRNPAIDIGPASSVRAACEGVDVLITATASTKPLVEAEWLQPGTHITAVGADDANKVELAPQCLRRVDRIVVDSRELADRYGDIAYGLARGVEPRHRPSELGDLIAGTAPGRTSPDQVTLCKLIGLGVQDLAAADLTLQRVASRTTPTARPASAKDLRQGGRG